MKIIKNEKLISRNAKIGQYASLAGILIIVGVMVFMGRTLLKPETATDNTTWIMLVVLLVSMIISQASMYFGTRWGRRPDKTLDKALKGLPGDFTLYHYTSPVPHLLIGPAGIWLILPYFLRGVVSYKKNRWRVGGGGFAQNYLRIFGQETIGRPDFEIESQSAALEKYFKKNFNEGESIPPIRAALVFLEEQAGIEAEGLPLPAMQIKKLKDFLRKAAKEQPFPSTELARIKLALPDD